VRYDPLRDSYEVVPSDRVPPLAVAAQRTRLSQAERRADPSGLLRRACVLAMLDLAEQGQVMGDPTHTVPHLLAVARLPEHPDVLKRLGFAWAAEPANNTPTQPARDVREILNGTTTPTPADLIELVMRLPKLPVVELRKARAVLSAAWGAAKQPRDDRQDYELRADAH